MWGLLCKDFFSIKKTAGFLLLLGTAYIVLDALPSGGTSSFMGLFLFFFLSMIPITVLTMEEKSHWSEYAAMMPYSRKMLVVEKYVLALASAGVSLVLYVVVFSLAIAFGVNAMSMAGVWTSACVGVCIGLVVPALNLPLVIAFGVAKGRLILFGSIALVIMGLGMVLETVGSSQISSLAQAIGSFGLVSVLGASVLVFVASMGISVLIDERKE